MGTDRTEVFRGPCQCGSGEFIIDLCTPDHPWPTKSRSYETKITCDNCKSEFSLVEQKGHIIVTRNSEIRQREKDNSIWYKNREAFMASSEVKTNLRKLEKLLSDQPSIAAAYRLLNSAGLVDSTEGTFRKHWSTPSKWIEDNISPENLRGVLKLLKIADEQIVAKIETLNKLWDKAHSPFKPIGKPIYRKAHD